MSKKYTSFWLFAMAMFALNLAHGAESLGVESKYFPACKGIRLFDEKDSLRPSAAGSQVIPAVAPTLKSVAEEREQSKFFHQIKNEIHEYLHVSKFHAEILRACVGLRDQWDSRWFLTLDSDPHHFDEYCRTSLRDFQGNLDAHWSKMRIALALSAPAIRSEDLTQSLVTKINPAPQHDLFRVAKLEPLTSEETSEALRQYDEVVKNAKELVRQKVDPEHPNHYEVSKALINAELGKFRRAQRKIYLLLIEQLPVMAFLTHGQPKGDELIGAFSKVVENAKSSLQEVQGKDLDELDLYAGYPAIINDWLKDHRDFCGMAHGWIDDVKKRDQLKSGLRLGILVVTSMIGGVADSLFIKFAAELFDFVNYSLYVHSAYEDYERGYAKAFASLFDQSGVADFERLDSEEQKLIMASVFIPFDIWHGTHTATSLIRSVMRR